VILLAGNGASALSWRDDIAVNTGVYSTLLAVGLYTWVGGIELRRTGRRVFGWRPQWRRVRFTLGAGLALAIPSVLFFAVASLQGGVGYSPIAALSVQGLLKRELVEIPLLTALVEDLVFRQFLYREFPQRTLGATLLTNAGIFTLWHLVVTARTVSETSFATSLWLLAGSYLGSLATVFVAGIVLAYVRVRTGSFLYSALTHWLLVGLITLAVWVWR
jgi:membrane protease YdiL (CAAX protease family)